MNILSFDIEEWYLEKQNHGNRIEQIKKFDRYLNEILDLLDERDLKATFFCVGGMAKDFPNVVQLIDSRGHEIGCHSFRHTWLNKMRPKEVMEDTIRSVDTLEQCVGKKIISYRAPAFSIGESNSWAFEALAQCGIERDSSIFPVARDFGGFPGFGYDTPVVVEREGFRFKEFPICTTSVFGKKLAYSGGGYFRFFPLCFIKQTMSRSDYTMCYFHLGDLIPETSRVMSRAEYEAYFKENGSWFNRHKRHIKSNLGKDKAYDKMRSLIINTHFMSLSQADSNINWECVPVVKL